MADIEQPASLWMQRIQEIPTHGGAANKTDVLQVTYPDHEQTTDLEYISGSIIDINGRPTLKIVERDKWHPLQVTSYIRVLKEYNILEKWIEVKSTGKEGKITIQNLMSGSILLPTDRYVMTQLSGSELGEFHPYTSDITPGLKVIENRMFKSNDNMPWFLIRPKQSESDPTGPAWWGCVHYSGNWKIAFDDDYERKYNYTLQVAAGINFQNTTWTLPPGQTFTTPVFSVGYTNGAEEGAARDNEAYLRNTILPEEYRYQLRPVIFNGWVTTTFNVNDSIELKLARAAASLGVELFVMDDGWFKGRTNGSAGLGDWVVDKNKFPNGLEPLIDSVHSMGMKFGLWVEPESVVTNSDVYRKHPNWVLGPEHGPRPGRMFINLAREDVFQHLFRSLNKILTDQ
ncbi:MAG: hypothetical protein EPN37_07885 [Chitinophagaceae bacterium]|nr:MAG: hypothetical protein EPN37_07885 [Chitinophagaceae bacterium]